MRRKIDDEILDLEKKIQSIIESKNLDTSYAFASFILINDIEQMMMLNFENLILKNDLLEEEINVLKLYKDEIDKYKLESNISIISKNLIENSDRLKELNDQINNIILKYNINIYYIMTIFLLDLQQELLTNLNFSFEEKSVLYRYFNTYMLYINSEVKRKKHNSDFDEYINKLDKEIERAREISDSKTDELNKIA